MAGEWIKFELSTSDKPEVLRMARLLGIDKDAVLGKLVRFWAWLDKNSVDGVVDGVVDRDVDQICLQVDFAKSLVAVGWLVFETEDRLRVPNFSRHNGESAKKRASKNEAQARWRKGLQWVDNSEPVDTVVDSDVDKPRSTKASTREEKRREDIKTNTSVSLTFDGSSFQNLGDKVELWSKAYPAIDIQTEMAKAAAWLNANPKNAKSNYARFLTNWFSRAQDKAPRVNEVPQSAVVTPIKARDWICAFCQGPATRKQGNAYYCSEHDHTSEIRRTVVA